ncbi:MAG: cytidine deaminase [Anaerolineae bacterium]|nr:cytidine deaminase [Anaerolineae bacterium]
MTKKISEQEIAALIEAAYHGYHNAYAPYSGYAVGAAVLGDDGHIYAGSNVENAVYPLTICAERVAITKAVSEGALHICAIAVITQNAGFPCGSCRQVIHEFGDDQVPVFVAQLDGTYETYSLGQLLPHSFSASDLIS